MVVLVVVLVPVSSTGPVAPEPSASRNTPTGMAAAGESTGVPSSHGGPYRTASRSEHQEAGEEQ